MKNTSAYRQIHGSCHCGNIRYTLTWPGDGSPIRIRACGCKHCRKHNAVWTSHPQARFCLDVDDDSRLTRYRFGTKTADFHVCAMCGVVPIVTCVIDGARYAVVNANTFDDVDKEQLIEVATDFEGETTADRLARRRSNWTPEATSSGERR